MLNLSTDLTCRLVALYYCKINNWLRTLLLEIDLVQDRRKKRVVLGVQAQRYLMSQLWCVELMVCDSDRSALTDGPRLGDKSGV